MDAAGQIGVSVHNGVMTSTLTRRGALAAAAAAGLGVPLAGGAAQAAPGRSDVTTVRIATYNAAMNRAVEGQLLEDLATGEDAQIRAVAEVIQRNNPDVLLLNEVDADAEQRGVDLFRENYLQVSQNGLTPISYPYAYTAPVNTGVPSGMDLNGDGSADGPDDAWGFGDFPGQYGMVLFSRYPILTDQVRTFQELTWASMPSNLIPSGFYPEEAVEQLRLSSKSHWDVPVRIGPTTVHMLAAHPTPPSFDGEERRNQRRNHDEIRLWKDYISTGRTPHWIVDDAGRRGGLAQGKSFVILGDLNADPADSDSWPGAVQQLLDHPRVADPLPTSTGAAQAGEGSTGEGDPSLHTANFSADGPGNLRVDYALPSTDLQVLGSSVFWPAPGQAGSELIGQEPPFSASDHRLVSLDLRLRA